MISWIRPLPFSSSDTFCSPCVQYGYDAITPCTKCEFLPFWSRVFITKMWGDSKIILTNGYNVHRTVKHQVKLFHFKVASFPRFSLAAVRWNLWPSITKWGSLTGLSKLKKKKNFIGIKTIFHTFWCKNDNSVMFLSKVLKCWTSPCMMSFKITSQRFGLSNIVICVYSYRLSWRKCSITPLFFHIFI